MKIGILTHPLVSNYGGVLQSYALSTYLRNQGHDVIVLNRQPNMKFLFRILKSILMFLQHPRYNNPKYRNISRFIKNNINYSRPLWSTKDLHSFIKNNNLSTIIVGSDQVWRADFAMSYGYNYFLDFVPDNIKKISYAASFGLSDWRYTNEQTKKLRKLIQRFEAISVREEEGVSLCKTHMSVNVDHVLDPTLLLTVDDYTNIMSERIVSEEYIFVYWLGTEKDKLNAISEIKNKSNITIVDLSLRRENDLIPIEDWLSYIKYAETVITDSFHGCVFSILFHKKLCLCKNESGGNGRLESLLKMLSIDISKYQQDYDKIETVLQVERNKSYKFIEEAIQ